MKSFLCSVLLLVICSMAGAQKEKAFMSRWHIESDVNSLPEAEYSSAKKGAVLYCLSNDDRNLCVDMKITETVEQSNILQMGMTIWLNTDGKVRKDIGIRYPVGAKFSRERSQSVLKPTPLSMANTIQLVGFGEPQQSRFPSDNQDNIRGSVKYDNDGNLIYHLTIPFDKIPGLDGAANPDNSDLWSIGIEYGAPPVMAGQSGGSQGMTGGRSGMPGGGGGRSGGGGRGGGGGMPSGGARPAAATAAATQPVIIWVKDLKLAAR